MRKYAKSTGGFYIDSLHDNIPGDAVEITDDEYVAAMAAQSNGKVLVGGPDGKPLATEPEGLSKERALQLAKNKAREIRSPMLDALTGIAGRAARADNNALADEADEMAGKLLAITDDPELNAATTMEAMELAVKSAYKRIAAAASAELAVVFREVTGA